MSDWNPDKAFYYRFQSNYAEITFVVLGMQEWSEEEFDSAADSDLASYVADGGDFWLDDCWEVGIDDIEHGIFPDNRATTTIVCPNHEGAFDCTPFCQLCEGNQEFEEKK